uniref:C2H2-type domain-containing protein n=1 Tax=Globodera rostochiensis TaxID=31243 RepID=A0A914IDN2_GLORO
MYPTPRMLPPEANPSTTVLFPTFQGPSSKSWSNTITRRSQPAAMPMPQPTAVYASKASSSTATELFIDTMSHHSLGPRDDRSSSSSHAFRTVSTSDESAKLILTRFYHNLQRQQHEQWLLSRDERNSTSSSDSGLPPSAGPFPLSPSSMATKLGPCSAVASSYSRGRTLLLPPAPCSASSLSPSWLSPLHIADSAFHSATTTPFYGSASVPPSAMSDCALVRVPAGGSRFRFDHLLPLPPPPAPATTRKTATGVTAAAEPSYATHPLLPLAPSSLQRLGGPALSSSSVSTSSATGLAPSTSGMATQQKPVMNTVRKKLQQKLAFRAIKEMPVLPHAEAVGTTPPSIVAKKVDDECKEEAEQFICSVCNKDFGRIDMLSRHRRCHTGEKPYGCDWCGRFFARADHLQMHKLTHTNKKPYLCAVCPYATRRCDVLKRHLGTRHQIKTAHSFFIIKKFYLLPKVAAQRHTPYDAGSLPPVDSQAAATRPPKEQK